MKHILDRYWLGRAMSWKMNDILLTSNIALTVQMRIGEVLGDEVQDVYNIIYMDLSFKTIRR